MVEDWYAIATQITLVHDNVTARRKVELYEVFEPERAKTILRRLRFAFIPKHGSWLNIAEIELSVLNRVALKQRIAIKQQLQE